MSQSVSQSTSQSVSQMLSLSVHQLWHCGKALALGIWNMVEALYHNILNIDGMKHFSAHCNDIRQTLENLLSLVNANITSVNLHCNLRERIVNLFHTMIITKYFTNKYATTESKSMPCDQRRNQHANLSILDAGVLISNLS